MRYLVVKVKKLLRKVISNEFEKLKLKVLFLNTYLPFEVRENAFFKLVFLNRKFRKSRVQYTCLFTNNAKFVIKFFKLSRFQLKMQFYKNYLVGIKRTNN